MNKEELIDEITKASNITGGPRESGSIKMKKLPMTPWQEIECCGVKVTVRWPKFNIDQAVKEILRLR